MIRHVLQEDLFDISGTDGQEGRQIRDEQTGESTVQYNQEVMKIETKQYQWE